MKRHIAQVTFSCIAVLCVASACLADLSPQLDQIIRLGGLPEDRVPVVTAVAIQPRGDLLATAGDDHVVRLWNIQDGRLVRELLEHRDWVTAVAFSRDGSRLLTGGRDRQVLVWDVASGRLISTLGEHRHPISSIVVSDVRDTVAIAGFRAPLKVYDLTNGQPLGALPCPCSDVRAIAFSPDMQFIAAGGRNGKIRIWNLANGKQLDFQAHDGRVRSAVFTSDNRLLSAGQDVAILWNAADGERIGRFSSEAGKVLSMTMLGENHFATAGADNLIRLFRFDSTQPISVLRGHTGSVAALDFRDGRLISGSFDTTVRVWALPQPRPAGDAATRSVSTAAPN